MRLRFTIGIIASILHARAAPPNVVRSTHPEEHLVNNYRRDNDGFNNQEEVLAPLKLAGVSSTQQASFDSLEYTPEVALESVGNGDAGWFDPRLHGGRMLDFATPNLGEPLNVIISAQSDPFVLTSPGFHAYVKCVYLKVDIYHLPFASPGRLDSQRNVWGFTSEVSSRPIWETATDQRMKSFLLDNTTSLFGAHAGKA